MADRQCSTKDLRSRFDEVYDKFIVGTGFVESDEYYRLEKNRYWRSFELLCKINLPAPADVLEIGGGQLAVLRKMLFGDQCVVGDISYDYRAPLQKVGIDSIIFNLMDPATGDVGRKFDLIILLEVIEHIPLPAYVVFERIKQLLKPDGLLFLTTPNLFRVRNLIRMFLGIEFLDHFMLPRPGEGLGHQLEYSAKHLQWQFERAGMETVTLAYDSLGHIGHSRKTKLARTLTGPLEKLRPILRDGLVAIAKNDPTSRGPA
jgi:SAM-dependent methyltransferase